MNIVTPTADYGVIIGRFQVHALTDAHIDLIEGVIARHTEVLILLGVSLVPGTVENPLDIISRREMILDMFPTVNIDAIVDVPGNNEMWSKQVDSVINKYFKFGTKLLYGGRLSFIPSYSGKHPTAQIEVGVSYSGTEVRALLHKQSPRTEEGRAGVIHATGNRYASGLATVDIVAVRKFGNEFEILLGKKAHEKGYRMVGGFFDPTKDKNLEQAAKREFYEETGGCEVEDITYVASQLIDDARYKSSKDKIITSVFVGKFIFGQPKASDDIDKLKWFKIADLIKLNCYCIIDNHTNMVQTVVEFLTEEEI
jgi:bifunctional NMN adenylyltransferase/nudix hydrolase